MQHSLHSYRLIKWIRGLCTQRAIWLTVSIFENLVGAAVLFSVVEFLRGKICRSHLSPVVLCAAQQFCNEWWPFLGDASELSVSVMLLFPFGKHRQCFPITRIFPMVPFGYVLCFICCFNLAVFTGHEWIDWTIFFYSFLRLTHPHLCVRFPTLHLSSISSSLHSAHPLFEHPFCFPLCIFSFC